MHPSMEQAFLPDGLPSLLALASHVVFREPELEKNFSKPAFEWVHNGFLPLLISLTLHCLSSHQPSKLFGQEQEK